MSEDTRLIDPDPLLAATFGEFETKTAFANASLADDTDYAAFTLDCIFEFNSESGKLSGAASERAQAPSAAKNSARRSVLKPPEFQYLGRYGDPAKGLDA